LKKKGGSHQVTMATNTEVMPLKFAMFAQNWRKNRGTTKLEMGTKIVKKTRG